MLRKEKAIRKPIMVKISPDLNNKQIDDVIDLIDQYNMDGVIACNTSITRDGLSSDPDMVEKIGNGGLSGRPIRERSTDII